MIGPDDVLLRGRSAIVTGSAVGIGRAVAVAMARFGADVAVCDRDGANLASAVAEIESTGQRAFSAILDVRDRALLEAFVSDAATQLGGVDILVNNAGGGFHAAFDDISDKGEDTLVRENFTSVTNGVKAVLTHMGPGGSIINITSIEAHRAAPGYAIYAAAKSAVASLTKSLALELGDRLIRVNCIAPDVIPTPGIGEISGPPRTPLARRGHVDDVAGAAVWLAGAMSSFVTGTTIHVDGGNLAAGGWRRIDNRTFAT